MIDKKSDTLKRLEACLPADGMVEIVEVREYPKKMKVMMRIRLVMRGNDWVEDALWNPLMTRILKSIYSAPNTRCFLGKSYFLRGNDMIYGWILCLYADKSHEDFLVPLETTFGVSKREASKAAQVGAPAPAPAAPLARGKPGPVAVYQSSRKPLDRELPPMRVQGAKAQPFNPNSGKGASPMTPHPGSKRSAGFRR